MKYIIRTCNICHNQYRKFACFEEEVRLARSKQERLVRFCALARTSGQYHHNSREDYCSYDESQMASDLGFTSRISASVFFVGVLLVATQLGFSDKHTSSQASDPGQTVRGSGPEARTPAAFNIGVPTCCYLHRYSITQQSSHHCMARNAICLCTAKQGVIHMCGVCVMCVWYMMGSHTSTNVHHNSTSSMFGALLFPNIHFRSMV